MKKEELKSILLDFVSSDSYETSDYPSVKVNKYLEYLEQCKKES